jgi:hypothetical protein
MKITASDDNREHLYDIQAEQRKKVFGGEYVREKGTDKKRVCMSIRGGHI